ncbi:Cytochrome P450 [Quillaja saponaria]|uniref:Cytochrome P450 n=1 Tax=Quillaja saponaria TaxID=32244 RepID=A0AAD7PVE5_QUISA|nr:Cytochrome P450 [Quillaja saponaria]
MFPLTLATPLVLLLVFILYIARATFFGPKHLKNGCKPPPGPPSLPIIGHLHLLGNLPHRTFETLAKKYGPIMSLRLGSVPAIVVSSPEAARLFLKTHDAVFANRPKIQATELMSYGSTGVATIEYGPYWRNIRKFCTLELFSPSKIESFAPLRKNEVGILVESIKKAAIAHEVIDLTLLAADFIETITYEMILGRSKDDRFDMKGLIHECGRLAGAFNISDYVPFLAGIDLQGLTRDMKKVSKDMDVMLETIMEEYEQDPNKQNGHHMNFIDKLLSLLHKPINPQDEEIHVLDKTKIKAIILDLIVAAYESTATTLSWTFSELLRNPRVMKKLQQEIQNVVGLNKMVEETDMPKLKYLDMLMRELFRLHPVAPFLIAHESMEDITINGYFIDKKSRIIVNAWAIGRDPKIWSENVEEFYPERFIDSNIDLKGRDFELIPFGSGRRGCPGMNLGLTTDKFIVAQLMHCFDWELPNGMKPEEFDMNESFGLTIPRDKHIFALPTYRLVH